jgi:TPR repeat protein
LQNQAGSVAGKNALAVCFMTGFGAQKDEVKGVRLLEECVAAGYPGALINLASAKHAGHGCAPDPTRAFELFKRSYEECSDQDAAFHLGLAYLRGKGTSPNHELAVKLFKVAPSAPPPFFVVRHFADVLLSCQGTCRLWVLQGP